MKMSLFSTWTIQKYEYRQIPTTYPPSTITRLIELTEFTADKNWQTASESKPYKEPELQTTPKETIIQNIKNIITEIKGDTQ